MSTSVCRVCLSTNVRMHVIGSVRLLELFEKLTSTKLNADNGRPKTICYMCLSLLQKCCRFSDIAHKSEQILSQLIHNGIEITQETVTPKVSERVELSLSKTDVQCMTIMNHAKNQSTSVTIKNELFTVNDEITVAEEFIDIEDRTLFENIANSMNTEQCFAQNDTHANNISTPAAVKGNFITASVEIKVEEELIDIEERSQIDNSYIVNSRNTQQCLLNETHRSYDENFYVYCGTCNKKYDSSDLLVAHLRTHIEQKRNTCKICSKTFAHASYLKKHLILHTGLKPHVCIICKKSFALAGTLKNHMLTHTGEKPYACKICKKSFAQVSHVTVHMRNHTGEKPYACKICYKNFTRSSHLKNHVTTHTGIKPSCLICGKAYLYADTLKRHMKTHTGDKP